MAISAAISAVAAVAVLMPGATPVQRQGDVLTRIPTKRKVVALTFDAGFNAKGIGEITRTLKRERVPATFFMTGKFARSHPAAIRKIAKSGFPVGNHSYRHPDFRKLSKKARNSEVRRADQAIRKVTGRTTKPLFRFPFGMASGADIRDVRKQGYEPIGWTVDTQGWKGAYRGRGPKAVVSRAVRWLRPGHIILMHCGAARDRSTPDADALPALIDRLRKEGYSFTDLRHLSS
ncbi:polysaccharide deacetylase family protein [Streptomyces sp. A7024]|uniref:Polysaccharide deacetylase family protein n=1 Tax=Streptomyces coryli TaxID=1128680 RepID=A0A6G4TTY5_9ACTN|nr:polysaccharide deacetylase family protein [Streptomyces coryli]NGN63334.1 polysaccharide deacetylase family protein [Streptomyces coryli]